MSGRIEHKYLVSNTLLDPIRADVLPYLERDAFSAHQGGLSEYTVRSIYYDTPHLACYLEKVEGVEMRRKFRIRGYARPDERSVVFLEIKRKNGNMISKNRAPLLHTALPEFLATPDIARHIIVTSGTTKEADDARRFLYYYYRYSLRPLVLVVYDREPFFGKFDRSLRVTFDKGLRGRLTPRLSDLYHEQLLSPVMERHFILEIKFFRGALPAWVLGLVKRYALPRMALSKYTMCLDSPRARGGLSPARRSAMAAGCISV